MKKYLDLLLCRAILVIKKLHDANSKGKYTVTNKCKPKKKLRLHVKLIQA